MLMHKVPVIVGVHELFFTIAIDKHIDHFLSQLIV